jgi:tartrate dehydrogenase/decarboxylase/D-malate dehydrogenase
LHGSVNDIAGKGIANSIEQSWSGAMMLEFVGHKEAHDAVLAMAEKVLEPKSVAPKTPDIGGMAKTTDVGKAIAEVL